MVHSLSQRSVTLENIKATAAVGRKKCKSCLSGRRVHQRTRVRDLFVAPSARSPEEPEWTDEHPEVCISKMYCRFRTNMTTLYTYFSYIYIGGGIQLLESLQCRFLALGLHFRTIPLRRLAHGVYSGRRNRNDYKYDTFDQPDELWANDAVRFGADLGTSTTLQNARM